MSEHHQEEHVTGASLEVATDVPEVQAQVKRWEESVVKRRPQPHQSGFRSLQFQIKGTSKVWNLIVRLT